MDRDKLNNIEQNRRLFILFNTSTGNYVANLKCKNKYCVTISTIDYILYSRH